MKTKLVDISLKELKPLIGNMVAGTNFEYFIIRYYQNIVTANHNTMRIVNRLVTNKLYHTEDINYTYADLMAVVREETYVSYYTKFLTALEESIFAKLEPGFKIINYDKLIDKNDLIVRYKVTY